MKAISLIFFVFVYSQIIGQSLDTLNHNNTRALISSYGNFFHDESNSEGGYEVPKNSGVNTIYYMRMQYMAIDSLGQIHANLGGYENFGTDVLGGPYSLGHNYDAVYQNKYKGKTWTICQEGIDLYRTWLEACSGPNATPSACQQAQVPTNELLMKLFEWPRIGNIDNGEDYWLLPFCDHSNSQIGVYDPDGGDTPRIKGECAPFVVQNDDAPIHTFSNSDPIGIEMRYMVYQYGQIGLLDDVTFLEVRVINRSGVDYADFSYGMYLDAMIGDYADDYFGSDSLNSLFYLYNNMDTDGLYGVEPPSFGVVALEPPFSSIVNYNSLSTLTENWNLMNGIQSSGQPFSDPQ